MNQRNCPNCAAPYDVVLNKCPYCGTSYYDLSALNLTEHEPFYLKIKTEMNGKPYYITQLVRPNMEMSISFTRNNTMTTNISFESVVTENNKNLCTIEFGG